MKKQLLIIWCITCCHLSLFAQKSTFLLGTDIPLQHAVGYEFRPVKWLGLQAKAGILTKPYDHVILDLMKSLKTDEQVLAIIKDAFELGTVGQFNFNFHSKHWYYGLQAQYIVLTASDLPRNLIENYYGVDFDPLNSGIIIPKTRIRMQSDLLQAGLCLGRKINLSKRLELRLEFTVAKNVWSNSNIQMSETKGTVFGLFYSEEKFEKDLEADLKETYSTFAYTPSLNIYLGIKL